jgi:hypothetical protein
MCMNDLDRGHWQQAMGTHNEGILQGYANLDCTQAYEHLRAQENIARKFGVSEEVQDELDFAKETLRTFQKLHASGDPVAEDIFQAMAEWIPKAQAAGREQASSTMSRIMTILQKMLSRDRDGSLAHHSAPIILTESDALEALIPKYAFRATNDEKYGHDIMQYFASILDTCNGSSRQKTRATKMGSIGVLTSASSLPGKNGATASSARKVSNGDGIGILLAWSGRRCRSPLATYRRIRHKWKRWALW